MHYSTFVGLLSLASFVHGHGVILAAQGPAGPSSQGFGVNDTLARNCTEISPCQLDTTIIRDAEISQNVVNGCGRTELIGNIDIGEQTELELAAKRVTTVTKGSTIQVKIHQVNADGAGPYSCDFDASSNANTFAFVPLKVTNNVPGKNGISDAKFKDFTIDVTMPDDFNCFGASTGDICTIRCRNNAVAGPFGGCFAVQQTDGTGRNDTTPEGVPTKQAIGQIFQQIENNKADLAAAIKANENAGQNGNSAGREAVDALVSSVSTATPPAATAAPGTGTGTGAGAGAGTNQGNNRGGNNAGNNGNVGKNTGNNGNAGKNAGNVGNNGNTNVRGNRNANANNGAVGGLRNAKRATAFRG